MQFIECLALLWQSSASSQHYRSLHLTPFSSPPSSFFWNSMTFLRDFQTYIGVDNQPLLAIAAWNGAWCHHGPTQSNTVGNDGSILGLVGTGLPMNKGGGWSIRRLQWRKRPSLTMAVGVCCRWPLQTAVRDYFCHFIDRPFIFVKSQKK
jgi:hypothetical protein